jgi:D-beta-D-heptose 7-phosphate kinase / D-beta-D-heptose 1-phosphate adenosyltransferase
MNIWVGGCFDILHAGHINLLWYAKLYENNTIPLYLEKNRLFVGLDSDERIKMLKGCGRPINDVETRVKLMSNLKMVDSVVVFHDDDELRYFIGKFDIDYIIAGDHYKDRTIIGAECARSGVVHYPTDGRSTTSLIEKVKKLIEYENSECRLRKAIGKPY